MATKITYSVSHPSSRLPGERDHYIGRVKVFSDTEKSYGHAKYLYSHSTGIVRYTKTDALKDAKKLADDLREQSKGLGDKL